MPERGRRTIPRTAKNVYYFWLARPDAALPEEAHEGGPAFGETAGRLWMPCPREGRSPMATSVEQRGAPRDTNKTRQRLWPFSLGPWPCASGASTCIRSGRKSPNHNHYARGLESEGAVGDQTTTGLHRAINLPGRQTASPREGARGSAGNRATTAGMIEDEELRGLPEPDEAQKAAAIAEFQAFGEERWPSGTHL